MHLTRALPASFWSFPQAARENGTSRVPCGIHFSTAVNAGYIQGERIGEWAFEHALRPATHPQASTPSCAVEKVGAASKDATWSIEAIFCDAIQTAGEQKSISLAKRAEVTYAKYNCQKGSIIGIKVPTDSLLAHPLRCSEHAISLRQNGRFISLLCRTEASRFATIIRCSSRPQINYRRVDEVTVTSGIYGPFQIRDKFNGNISIPLPGPGHTHAEGEPLSRLRLNLSGFGLKPSKFCASVRRFWDASILPNSSRPSQITWAQVACPVPSDQNRFDLRESYLLQSV